MRRITLISTIALLAVNAMAQSDSEFQAWMKTAGATMGSLNKNIAAKDGAMATADAEKLAATFKQVEDFWKQRSGADDAVNFAIKAQAAATTIGKDVSAGNFDQAPADVKALQSNCGGCHMAHREGTAGSFKIK